MSLFLASALVCGGYTGGSWETIRVAPALVIIWVTSLCIEFTLCLVAFLRAFVPHSRTTVAPGSWSWLSRVLSLASWRVADHTFMTSWFVHVIR